MPHTVLEAPAHRLLERTSTQPLAAPPPHPRRHALRLFLLLPLYTVLLGTPLILVSLVAVRAAHLFLSTLHPALGALAAVMTALAPLVLLLFAHHRRYERRAESRYDPRCRQDALLQLLAVLVPYAHPNRPARLELHGARWRLDTPLARGGHLRVETTDTLRTFALALTLQPSPATRHRAPRLAERLELLNWDGEALTLSSLRLLSVPKERRFALEGAAEHDPGERAASILEALLVCAELPPDNLEPPSREEAPLADWEVVVLEDEPTLHAPSHLNLRVVERSARASASRTYSLDSVWPSWVAAGLWVLPLCIAAGALLGQSIFARAPEQVLVLLTLGAGALTAALDGVLRMTPPLPWIPLEVRAARERFDVCLERAQAPQHGHWLPRGVALDEPFHLDLSRSRWVQQERTRLHIEVRQTRDNGRQAERVRFSVPVRMTPAVAALPVHEPGDAVPVESPERFQELWHTLRFAAACHVGHALRHVSHLSRNTRP